jgi:glycosyltransferase involved in cell wall biosynthesis
VRDPIGLVHRSRARGAVTLLLAASVLPRGIRRGLARPLAPALERRADTHPRSRFVPPAAFIARWAAGPASDAAVLAQRLGTAPSVDPRARRSLASLAHAARMRHAADAIVRSAQDDASPDLEFLRARLAFGGGEYRRAIAHAQVAAAAGIVGAAELADQAVGHLTVLEPGWLPDLGAAGVRLAAGKGRAVKGRVLHLVSISLPYREVGYTVRTQSVVRCQAGAGLDPHVVTRAGFPRTEGIRRAPTERPVDGIPHHFVAPDDVLVDRPDRLLARSARLTTALLEELRPAVLQPASNHLQAQTALALARPLGIPVVYEVRGFWEESWISRAHADEAAAMETDRYRGTREVETAAMLASDAVVTLSEVMRAEIIARGCAPENVVVVPNAVEVETFVPRPRDDALGASLGIRVDDVVVGYISSFNAYEGIPYLLEAVAALRPQVPRLRVLLVGDGDESETIREAGRRLGLDDGTLVMPGRVPHAQVLGYYSLIDVFVVPRTADRVSRLVTPLKPYEAMALERAVVVSDLPALREIVHPDETGLTFRAEDPDDLASVLGRLIEDPALRRRLGSQAREWILAERTWTANGRRYRELFERLGVV